jgi:hypothetical protein
MQELKFGEVCTANRMNDFVGGKHQGGIRYSGNFPDLRRIGIIIGGGADAIYPDELHVGSIAYIGEGQEGDQKLTFGNRALAWAHLIGMPVHVFIHRNKNSYEYRGPHLVETVAAMIASDRNKNDRGAFVFGLISEPGPK